MAKEICWECTGAGNGVGITHCKVCRGTGYIKVSDVELTAEQKKARLQTNLNEVDRHWEDLKKRIVEGKITMFMIPDELYKISSRIKKEADYIVTDILKIKGGS